MGIEFPETDFSNSSVVHDATAGRGRPASYSEAVALVCENALRLRNLEFKGVYDASGDIPTASEYPYLAAASLVHDLAIFSNRVAVGPEECAIAVIQFDLIVTGLEVGR